MSTLKGKTIVITGGSRGIGLAIGIRFATDGANIVILSKDTPERINEVSNQILEAGGKPLVLDIDVTDQRVVHEAVSKAAAYFGGIDILINNTSATCFTKTVDTSSKRFDLAIGTSVRAAFFLSQACIPYLKHSSNPHIVNISPPLNMDPTCFKDHLAFSLSKYAMSLCTLGMAEEFKQEGIAINSLWPKTTIATQTIKDHFLPKVYAGSRWPTIMADAAYALVLRRSRNGTGHFFTDEELLQATGRVDFSQYAVDPNTPLMQALFLPKESELTPVSQDLFLDSSQKS